MRNLKPILAIVALLALASSVRAQYAPDGEHVNLPWAPGPPAESQWDISSLKLAQAPLVQQPSVSPPSDAASAKIRVTVHEDALIWFDGVLTNSVGTDREFVTPPITRQGTYKLKVRNGTRDTAWDLAVRPGDNITLDLRSGSPRVTGTRSGETTGGISTERPPFAQSSGDQSSSGVAPPLTADLDPWLSRAETEHIKARWPKSVVWPTNLKFYRLAPRYQFLTTMNNGRTHVTTIKDIHDEESREFTVSGGMAAIDASKWKSVKGLAIPAGEKIAVWKEATDVSAYSLVPRWRWRFPVKTVAYDVLFNADWDVFEVRTREKGAEGWVPSVEYKNAKASPEGYHGAGKACNSCHVTAGRIMDVPGRIYRRERWGSDTVMSWRPFDEAGNLDYRWPI